MKRLHLAFLAAVGVLLVAMSSDAPSGAPAQPSMRGVLVTPEEATAKALREFKREALTGVVLSLRDGETGAAVPAAARVRAAGLDLYYWIEIGRCPALAEAHPEWMASLQGHSEWRRLFPNAPEPGAGEVVKNYPWVPVLYQEAFGAHLQRVKSLLRALPPARGIFLNDLQSAPSACGCGNTLCRWTPDYGPIRTATHLPADAAARFLTAVATGAERRRGAPGAEIIPVWTTECEEQEKDAACAGVACFPGACWREYTAQLMPVARECQTLAVLCLYRAFGRDQPRYGGEAGWVGQALRSFVEMPPQRGGQSVPTPRLIGVVQGWVANGFAPLIFEGWMMEIVKGRAVSRTTTGYDDVAIVVEAVAATASSRIVKRQTKIVASQKPLESALSLYGPRRIFRNSLRRRQCGDAGYLTQRLVDSS